MLTRAMVLVIERKTNVITLLNQAEASIETIQNVHLKEYLKVFQLILQVCHFLQLGHIKSVKMTLKQLQQSIQTIIATNWPSDEQIFGQNPIESFMWLPKEQMYVLVYLVTVSHSMMAGYMEKAQKYTEKALTQIEKLKAQENKSVLGNNILALFQIILLEHIIMCRLVMGNRSLAIKEIAAAKDVCLSTSNKSLLKSHSPQLHCLLGLYAMSANLFAEAEAQFHVCLSEAIHKELKLFANLNLAIVYLRTQKSNELKQLLDSIGNDNTQSFTNQAMLGSYYYVQGLQAFHKNGFQEAK
jgi:MAternally-affected-uncoordination protein